MGFINDLIQKKIDNFAMAVNSLIQVDKMKEEAQYLKNNTKTYLNEFDKLKEIKFQEKQFIISGNWTNFNYDNFYDIEIGNNPQGYFYHLENNAPTQDIEYNNIYFEENTTDSILKRLQNVYDLFSTSTNSLYYNDGSIDKYYNHNEDASAPASFNWVNYTDVKNNLLNELNSLKSFINSYIDLLQNNLTWWNNVKSDNNQYIKNSDLDTTEDWSNRVNTLQTQINIINSVIDYINNTFADDTISQDIYDNIEQPINNVKTFFNSLLTTVNNENALKTSGVFWIKYKFWIKQYIGKPDGVYITYKGVETIKNQSIKKRNESADDLIQLGGIIKLATPQNVLFNENHEADIIANLAPVENDPTHLKILVNYVWTQVMIATKYTLQHTVKLNGTEILNETIIFDKDNNPLLDDQGNPIEPKTPQNYYNYEILIVNNGLVTNTLEINYTLKAYHEPYLLTNLGINTWSATIESDEYNFSITKTL